LVFQFFRKFQFGLYLNNVIYQGLFMQTSNQQTATLEALTRAVSLPRLVREDQGEAVRLLQQLLIGLGYNIRVDAEFGSNTENAVKNFQEYRRDIAQVVDGKVGILTWRALGDEVFKRLQQR
jgi:peptidoglycan hydrolase-like protein with peptidoglycan-binding domain